MTLGKRLFFTNTLFIAALVIVAAVTLWGVLSMRSDLYLMVYEHRELALINEISVRVAEASGALRDDLPDRSFVTAMLEQAAQDSRSLRELQTSEGHRDADHAEREESLIADTISGLEAIKARIQSPFDVLHRADTDAVSARAVGLMDNLKALAQETQRAASGAQDDAASNIRWTLSLTLGNCVALIVAAVCLGLTQYHRVMRPLQRLRAGVRLVARGRFDHLLTTEGDSEFVELANDYNRMAGELRTLYQNLEEKVAAKSRDLVRSERLASVGFLAAGVAHEINNPLGIISTFAELSMRRLAPLSGNPAVAEVSRWQKMMHEEAFRCKGIIEKLLSLSRKGNESRGPVILAQVAGDVAAMVGRLGRSRDQQVSIELQSLDGLVVNANEAEIKQVLLNLVVNAVESVESRGQVRVEGGAEEDMVAIHIHDNGCGMSPQTLEHAFEPFFTHKPGGSGPGVGLGLSICHAIVESHHGRITAHSEGPGKGSRFTIHLPRAALEPV
jgi:signal transduction histidine kinase